MSFQEPEVFAGECSLTVVDFLIADVFSEVFVIESCDREGPVTMLPSKVPTMRECLVDPTCGIRLDSAHELGERERAWRFNVEVDMISYSAGTEELPAFTFHNPINARVQPGPPFRIQPGSPILGGPHQMNPKREIGICHLLDQLISG
jgi:hypothetical protein